MSVCFFAKKLGMTRVFDQSGALIPVTLLQIEEPVMMRERETNGQTFVQCGYVDEKNSLNKPQKGQFESISLETKKYIREFVISEEDKFELGKVVSFSSQFKIKDKVDVSGKSKGKGFAGVIKRHGFSRGPETHGSRHHRKPGSLGFLDLARVRKGKKLPGRMGGKKVTTQNLSIVAYDEAKKLLYLEGAVPGPNKAYVSISSAVKS